MVDSLNEWLEWLVKDGLLCEEYQKKLKYSHSKSRIMDLALDSNGIAFLCEMAIKGHEFPYEVLTREFKRYINGNYVASHGRLDRSKYTGSMYCQYNNDVFVETTCIALLGCVCNVFVKDNDYVRICLDRRCMVNIFCPKSSKCILEVYGGACVMDANAFGNIEIVKID